MEEKKMEKEKNTFLSRKNKIENEGRRRYFELIAASDHTSKDSWFMIPWRKQQRKAKAKKWENKN